jgi:thioredoxin 1
MRQLTTEQLTEKLNNNEKVLVDFFATWCGPCKALVPTLESIQNNYEGVEFVKLDVDQNTDLAMQMGVRSVPTVILFEGKKEVFRATGANTKNFYDKVITESFNL